MTEFDENVDVYGTSGADPFIRRNLRVSLDRGGKINVFNHNGSRVIEIDGEKGKLEIFQSDNPGDYAILRMNGGDGIIGLGGHGKDGTLNIYNKSSVSTIFINSGKASITLSDPSGRESILLDGTTGDLFLHDQEGKRSFALTSNTGGYAGMWIGGNAAPSEGPKAGKVFLRDSAGNDSIVLDGDSGDIVLNNADCAEEFDIINQNQVGPGTVLVIENEEKLRECNLAYDRRVAGVISGGGNYKPGILLGKKGFQDGRKPVALMGKVYCKVDANFAPINVGDMLTTSSTRGHAMKALDPALSFGAVLGKALQSLKKGKGLIPILITLH
jgi:hypothetical protein